MAASMAVMLDIGKDVRSAEHWVVEWGDLRYIYLEKQGRRSGLKKEGTGRKEGNGCLDASIIVKGQMKTMMKVKK